MTSPPSATTRTEAAPHDRQHRPAHPESRVLLLERLDELDAIDREIRRSGPWQQGSSRGEGDVSVSAQVLERRTFSTSHAADFMEARALVSQTGQPEDRFGYVVITELLDNPLDACETTGVGPAERTVLSTCVMKNARNSLTGVAQME